jgi:transposase-like protein
MSERKDLIGKRPAAGKRSGYLGKYRPEMADEVRGYYLNGATDNQVADILEVTPETISQWKRKHPEFARARREGKAYADAKVVNALFQRALGYTQRTVRIDPDGKQTVTVTELPPDVKAATFWLERRQRDQWGPTPGTLTDDTGREVYRDPMEIARRIAFVLSLGLERQRKAIDGEYTDVSRRPEVSDAE